MQVKTPGHAACHLFEGLAGQAGSQISGNSYSHPRRGYGAFAGDLPAKRKGP
ncbi:hypothetical protein CSB93_5593 [Pseudomonas paraeruginosa]|uniref:Uncharacterized protein n=1 Tax=Pseudomonas paraeruginosa TaxID=2994495 RepID=A0A2R3J228_9PSED|nr:hypothetical protein CSB93_5593 [Pseudomonas paraeruginosa]AWE90703.1 hypothetical protein CSC28_4391 [Pseudomonas paraeruginosa]